MYGVSPEGGKAYSYVYGGEVIELVDNFKYLGLLFATISETSNKIVPYLSIMQYRLQQGKRLIAAWKRRCVLCHQLPPRVAASLFQTCVMPALEYGVGL